MDIEPADKQYIELFNLEQTKDLNIKLRQIMNHIIQSSGRNIDVVKEELQDLINDVSKKIHENDVAYMLHKTIEKSFNAFLKHKSAPVLE